jgi:hypothetical protein
MDGLWMFTHIPLDDLGESRGICKHKDMFGKPGQGVHSYRFLGVAIVDVIMTMLAAWWISYVFGWPLWICMVSFFVLGILAHRLYCVRTKIDTLLFP